MSEMQILVGYTTSLIFRRKYLKEYIEEAILYGASPYFIRSLRARLGWVNRKLKSLRRK